MPSRRVCLHHAEGARSQNDDDLLAKVLKEAYRLQRVALLEYLGSMSQQRPPSSEMLMDLLRCPSNLLKCNDISCDPLFTVQAPRMTVTLMHFWGEQAQELIDKDDAFESFTRDLPRVKHM